MTLRFSERAPLTAALLSLLSLSSLAVAQPASQPASQPAVVAPPASQPASLPAVVAQPASLPASLPAVTEPAEAVALISLDPALNAALADLDIAACEVAPLQAVKAPEDKPQDECEVGSGRCTAEGAQLCKRIGPQAKWQPASQCSEGQTCEDGRCHSLLAKILVWSMLIGMLLAFIYMIFNYQKGLKGSPYELYILFATKIIEYTAYGAMQMTFVLFLSKIVKLSDFQAGSYIGAWSVSISLVTIMVGALVDAIGIRRTLIIGTVALLVARLFLPFSDNFWIVTVLGFVPMAIGTAIMAPVISVGIKRYTTKEGASLGFGLFYTLMNVGWAAGGWLFDYMRAQFGENNMTAVPLINMELHTYQLIFLVGFVLTIPTFFMVFFMRNGVKMTDDQGIVITAFEKMEGSNFFAVMINSIKKAALETGRIMSSVFKEKSFWIFMFMIGVLIGVRLVFLHFHYTFPKYGIRVFGEGVKIGSIYGVLNPVIIVFLVPMVAFFTKKVSSYKMMIVGTFLSAGSVFIAIMPESWFAQMEGGIFGELVYNWWLNVHPSDQRPLYMSLIVFITVFTVGEAFWSPRLMQFTAEIAPEGREGTYISLAMLPLFLGKLVAGPLSGWLVQEYTPVTRVASGCLDPSQSALSGGFWAGVKSAEVVGDLSHHYMVWVWIGVMAMASPIGLVIFRKMFTAAEQKTPAKKEV